MPSLQRAQSFRKSKRRGSVQRAARRRVLYCNQKVQGENPLCSNKPWPSMPKVSAGLLGSVMIMRALRPPVRLDGPWQLGCWTVSVVLSRPTTGGGKIQHRFQCIKWRRRWTALSCPHWNGGRESFAACLCVELAIPCTLSGYCIRVLRGILWERENIPDNFRFLVQSFRLRESCFSALHLCGTERTALQIVLYNLYCPAKACTVHTLCVCTVPSQYSTELRARVLWTTQYSTQCTSYSVTREGKVRNRSLQSGTKTMAFTSCRRVHARK